MLSGPGARARRIEAARKVRVDCEEIKRISTISFVFLRPVNELFCDLVD